MWLGVQLRVVVVPVQPQRQRLDDADGAVLPRRIVYLVALERDGRHLAAFSANQHEAFFAEAFDLRLASGEPSWSGCAAFGLERWLLAFLVEHGPSPSGWPREVLP